jgi:hypothetical protein
MLVIARKRHEALTIGGNIRVEVLRLSPGVARLRFAIPSGVAIQRGVPRAGDPAAIEAGNGGIDSSGMGVVDLTLCDQQIVTVRNDVHLGLVDVDATRAVLFVDSPDGTAVHVEASPRPRPHGRPSAAVAGEARQALLPFSAPSASEPAPPANANGHAGPRKNPTESTRETPVPRTIPFPWAGGGEPRAD